MKFLNGWLVLMILAALPLKGVLNENEILTQQKEFEQLLDKVSSAKDANALQLAEAAFIKKLDEIKDQQDLEKIFHTSFTMANIILMVEALKISNNSVLSALKAKNIGLDFKKINEIDRALSKAVERFNYEDNQATKKALKNNIIEILTHSEFKRRDPEADQFDLLIKQIKTYLTENSDDEELLNAVDKRLEETKYKIDPTHSKNMRALIDELFQGISNKGKATDILQKNIVREFKKITDPTVRAELFKPNYNLAKKALSLRAYAVADEFNKYAPKIGWNDQNQCVEQLILLAKTFDAEQTNIKKREELNKLFIQSIKNIDPQLLYTIMLTKLQAEDNGTLLHVIAKYGTGAMIETLLQQLADEKMQKKVLDIENTENASPLLTALKNANTSAAFQLILSGADIKKVDSTENGPLHLAAKNMEESNIIRKLLERGASQHKNNYNETPLDIAQRKNNAIFIQVVTEFNGAVNLQQLTQALQALK